MIAGPGNAFVAEAKRQLSGRVGIDLFAGPTETLIIADDTLRRRNVRDRSARPGRARSEFAGHPAHQFRHSWPRDTMKEIERQLQTLPTAAIAGQAWADYGQVILCKDQAEMVKEADRIASEHVQVMTKDPDYFLQAT